LSASAFCTTLSRLGGVASQRESPRYAGQHFHNHPRPRPRLEHRSKRIARIAPGPSWASRFGGADSPMPQGSLPRPSERRRLWVIRPGLKIPKTRWAQPTLPSANTYLSSGALCPCAWSSRLRTSGTLPNRLCRVPVPRRDTTPHDHCSAPGLLHTLLMVGVLTSFWGIRGKNSLVIDMPTR